MSNFDYIAGPYFHEREDIREARFNALTIIAAQYAQKGRPVYSPITQGHPMHIASSDATMGNHEFWAKFNRPFLRAASRIIIVKLPGWQKSLGLTEEVRYFAENGKEMTIIDDPRPLLPQCLWPLLLDGV